MNTKNILLSSINNVTVHEFKPYMNNPEEHGDQLLKVGFKTFTIGTTRWFVFRPTMNKLNWALNFVFPSYRIPYGNKDSPIRIHSGFLADYMTLRDDVHCIIAKDRDITEYIFCGHSLGGALARLAAVDAQYNFCIQATVYTLGAPNVGNKAFEDSFNKRIHHSMFYVNDKDPVPTVPPEALGYKAYVRTRLPSYYTWNFWLNHLPDLYFTNLLNRDTTGEIL